jgi:BlaI family penicillinase repressor
MRNNLVKVVTSKQKLPVPTTAELRLLQILWDVGEGSVDAIVNAHPEKERPHYKTTQTLLRIMETKGFIAHESLGRVFIFRPLASRKTVDRLSVQALVSQNFHGSAAGLLSNLLESNAIKKNELDELESYMREYRRRHEQGNRSSASSKQQTVVLIDPSIEVNKDGKRAVAQSAALAAAIYKSTSDVDRH